MSTFLISFYNLHHAFYTLNFVLLFAVIAILLAYYYKKVNYLCPHCNKVFKPTFYRWAIAFHTPTKRKLLCPHCRKKDYCKETDKEIDLL